MKKMVWGNRVCRSGCILLAMLAASCASFRPCPDELQAGRKLFVERESTTFLKFELGKTLAEERRNQSPIGPPTLEVAVRSRDSVGLREDLNGAGSTLLVSSTVENFFFFEEATQRLTQISRNPTGWRSRVAKSLGPPVWGDWSANAPSLEKLHLSNLTITPQGPEPIVDPRDHLVLDVLEKDAVTPGQRTLNFGAGAQALFTPGSPTQTPTFTILNAGATLGKTVAEIEKNKSLLFGPINKIERVRLTASERSVSVSSGTGSGAKEKPYEFGMTLGDSIRREGALPPARLTDELRLVLMRPRNNPSAEVLFGVKSNGECWFGKAGTSSVALFPGDSLTIMPELYNSKRGAVNGSVLYRQLVAFGQISEERGTKNPETMFVYVSHGKTESRLLPFTEGMTLSDALRFALPLAPSSEKEFYRPVLLQASQSRKPPILFAASVTRGCWFGHDKGSRAVRLAAGDRIQIMSGRYDPETSPNRNCNSTPTHP